MDVEKFTVQCADAFAPQGIELGAESSSAVNETEHPIQVVTKAGSRPPLDPEHAAVVAERKARNPVGRPRTTTRDAVIQAQYKQIAKHAPVIIQRLLEGAMDRDDPLHKECLDIMAKRVAPIAFYEALSKQEFKDDEDKDQRPVVTINIANATAKVGGAIEVVAKEK